MRALTESEALGPSDVIRIRVEVRRGSDRARLAAEYGITLDDIERLMAGTSPLAKVRDALACRRIRRDDRGKGWGQ